MARRVIVVDDDDPRFWDPRYAAGRLLDEDEPDDAHLDEDDEEDDDEDYEDRGWHDRGWQDFPAAQPRLPADGIKAVSQRGAIATTWWSRRFLAAIGSPETSGRLTRGRSYARSGQVLSLTITPGTVASQVQGSRRQPYDVTLSVPTFRDADWNRIIPALAGQAAYSAALLAGQLPQDIEEMFKQLGISLFPTARQLNTQCSCPDWANPCKHAAAVCYLLAERFDADPFTVLALRGMPREPLLAAIGAQRERFAGGDGAGRASDAADELSGFWDIGDIPPLPPLGEAAAGRVIARLGPVGVTARGSDLSEVLRPAYEAMARHRAQ